MSSIVKFEKIIPIGKQEYAYQCENVDTFCKIEGRLPWKSGSEPYPNEEKDEIEKYELEILKFTSNSLTINFRKYYKNGKIELYQSGGSFANLVNQIFKDKECNLYIEKEPRV